MATLTKGKTFTNGELVTPQKLHELVDLGGVAGIVNSDIADGAAIADSKLATISTAGKVANSATTATSANTANAIVARDASGNFSAGTITAALSGNATTATTAAACSGNAATATKLATARTINGVAFDGSANISIATGVSGTIPVSQGGTGATTASGALTNLGAAAASHTHSAATASAAGFMSAADKSKLDGLSSSSSTFATDISVNGVTVGKGNGPYGARLGIDALTSNTTGASNTAIGYWALVSNTTGSTNTAIGSTALNSQTTATGNTAIGYAAITNSANYSNIVGLGAQTEVTGNNQVQLGKSNTTTYAYGAVQNRSDVRDKADIRDTQLGLEFISSLRPVDFKWDMREDYRPDPLPGNATEEERAAHLESAKLANITHDGSKKRNRYHHGLIAQEVKAVLDAQGIDFGGYQDHKIAGGDDVLSIGYDELIAPLIKAVQELAARVAALESAK